MQRIFISSVQKEFAEERRVLGEYLSGDPLFRRFFETFLFEYNVPASDRRPDEVYLEEVAHSDLYVGLFGNEYGRENAEGLSPTHLEFNEATRLGKPRLIFVKGNTDDEKQPKMHALIQDAGSQLVRRRFINGADLIGSVYASLVEHLEKIGHLNQVPWDARTARNATLDDLDAERIARFVRRANYARNFPLTPDAEIREGSYSPEPVGRWPPNPRCRTALCSLAPAFCSAFRGQVRPLSRYGSRQAHSVLPSL